MTLKHKKDTKHKKHTNLSYTYFLLLDYTKEDQEQDFEEHLQSLLDTHGHDLEIIEKLRLLFILSLPPNANGRRINEEKNETILKIDFQHPNAKNRRRTLKKIDIDRRE